MFDMTDADFRSLFKECLAELYFERESTIKNDFIKYALTLAIAAIDENERALNNSLERLVAIYRRLTERNN